MPYPNTALTAWQLALIALVAVGTLTVWLVASSWPPVRPAAPTGLPWPRPARASQPTRSGPLRPPNRNRPGRLNAGKPPSRAGPPR